MTEQPTNNPTTPKFYACPKCYTGFWVQVDARGQAFTEDGRPFAHFKPHCRHIASPFSGLPPVEMADITDTIEPLMEKLP